MRTISTQLIVLAVVFGIAAYGFVAEPGKPEKPVKKPEAAAPQPAKGQPTKGPFVKGDPTSRNGQPPVRVASRGTIKLLGTGFTGSSVVVWDGTAMPTTFIDEHELRVEPPAHAPGNVQVWVDTNGATSNELTYTYLEDLTLNSLDPNSGSVSGGGPH